MPMRAKVIPTLVLRALMGLIVIGLTTCTTAPKPAGEDFLKEWTTPTRTEPRKVPPTKPRVREIYVLNISPDPQGRG